MISQTDDPTRLQLLRISKRLDAIESPQPSYDHHVVNTYLAEAPVPTDRVPAAQPRIVVASTSKPSAPIRSNGNSRARNRRIELSRAVRATMIAMMGISSSSDDLPPFEDPLPVNDANEPLWRWDWSRTMNQSDANQRFLNAIVAAIEEARDGPEKKHADVPEEDWPHIRAAVESAYTNLRREKTAREDDVKRLRKEETKRRNRKRGLKEEKSKRRKAAWNAACAESGFDARLASFGFPDVALAEEALDIRYMSSEDSGAENEAATAGDNGLLEDGTLAATPAVSVKLFTVRPPAWRTAALGSLYGHLDGVKPPERSCECYRSYRD